MFFKFNKKHALVASGILRGMTDIHSHILPGVDDGSPTVQSSLGLLRFFEELGVAQAWLTPHIMADRTQNTPEKLMECFEQFKRQYAGPIVLHQAGEYMMDAAFPDKLNTGVLPLGKKHLLVETSYMLPPVGLHDILEQVRHAGYFPLIAHPERYTYMEKKDYIALHEEGYEFQLNLMSLSGYYNPGAKAVSEWLLKKGMYTYVGSDLHHLERYQPMLEEMKLTAEQLDALSMLIANNEYI